MARLTHPLSRAPSLLMSLLLALPAQAEICRYTQVEDGADSIALGYPVPRPVDSLEPIAGFRSQDSLLARLDALALESPELSAQPIGQSRLGERIVAYSLGDGDTLTAEGLRRPAAMLHSGGIHAREWASQEAVTGIVEGLLAGLNAPGIDRYLVDHLQLIFVPALNPDSWDTTQRFAARTRLDERCNPSGTPRDGRMRRKNLRDSDGDLATAGDTLLGVDLNRNIGPLWDSANQSSSNPSDIRYKGPARESEPETQALLAAAALAPDSLRLYIDTHSFGRVLFFNTTGETPRLTDISRSLAQTMGRVASPAYAASQVPPNQRFGSTDEQFGFVQQVPAYTLEIEPGTEQQGVEYGGNAVSHSGFVLPDAEVPRMREEILAMSRLAYYHQAGPPALLAVTVTDIARDTIMYAAVWQADDSSRTLHIDRNDPLEAGRNYRLELRFSKPMRVRDADGAVSNYPGQSVSLSPVVELMGSRSRQTLDNEQGWLGSDRLHYNDDSWATSFSLDEQLGGDALALRVTVRDMAGLALDANPATPVDWADGHWLDYDSDDGSAGDSGGSDRQHQLSLLPGEPPADDRGGGGSGSGNLLGLLLIADLLRRRRRRT